jgi:hypothetical protein
VTFRDLSGLPPQFEVRSEAEKWQGAFKAAQGAVREQGQVVSLALDNNRSLWETNKKLREERLQFLATCQRLEHERNELLAKLNGIPQDIKERAELQLKNDELVKVNAILREELVRWLQPELNSEQLRERMEALKTQKDELQATGLVPTEEEVARRDFFLDRAKDDDGFMLSSLTMRKGPSHP